ncbi:MAG TPA: hypothetical protein DHU55_00780, partial [Blastocatellia bacterium]|nr:hypothetical protein [Blastocatellia bacterium]
MYVDFLHLPHNPNSKSSTDFLVTEYLRLQEHLEALNGHHVSDDALNEAITLYNVNRALTRHLYDERARQPHLIRTSELYALVRVGNFLPVAQHTELLRRTVSDLPSRVGKQRDSI